MIPIAKMNYRRVEKALEERATLDGNVYYVNSVVNHINHITIYTDLRLEFATEYREISQLVRQRFDGSSSTALDVLYGRDLRSKVALITGANTVIGFETARSLALHGCNVILACRNLEKANEAVKRIQQEKATANCSVLKLDLTSLDSVREAASEFKQKFQALHILILNAGVAGLSYQLTKDDYEMTFQVNHLAQFYLTMLLEHVIHNSSNPRIVVVQCCALVFNYFNSRKSSIGLYVITLTDLVELIHKIF